MNLCGRVDACSNMTDCHMKHRYRDEVITWVEDLVLGMTWIGGIWQIWKTYAIREIDGNSYITLYTIQFKCHQVCHPVLSKRYFPKKTVESSCAWAHGWNIIYFCWIFFVHMIIVITVKMDVSLNFTIAKNGSWHIEITGKLLITFITRC